MIIYQFHNYAHIFFIVLFSVLAVLSIVVGIYLFPLLKMCFSTLTSSSVRRENGVSLKAAIILSTITFVLYLVCIVLLISSPFNIASYAKMMINTDMDNCRVLVGEIDEVEFAPNEHRGNIVDYNVKFSVDNETYFINNGVGVLEENIDKLSAGNKIKVYYICMNGENEVVRIESVPVNE